MTEQYQLKPGRKPLRLIEVVEQPAADGRGTLMTHRVTLRWPGEPFTPTAAQLAAFGDALEPVDATAQPPAPGRYRLRARGSSWFDVMDSATGQAVNPSALRQPEAAALRQELDQTPVAAGPAAQTEDQADGAGD